MDARNVTFMFYGLAVAWLILAIYAVTLVARERGIRRQLDALKRLVEEKR